MDKPEISPREVVYENQYLQIYRVKAQFADYAKTFYVSDFGPRAGVLLARGDEVLFVRQYRLLINEIAWEIPGGKVDADETPRDAALRECLEETSLRCLNLQPLIYYHPGLDTCQNPTHIFYCTEFEEVPTQKIDRQEIAELVWLPFSRCLEMVFEGQIVDCLTVAAILAFQAKKRRV